MKRKILFGTLTGVMLSILCVFNLTISTQRENDSIRLQSFTLMAKAVELESIVITCGSFRGRCWILDPWMDGEYWHDCRFSGYQSDFC